MLQNLTVLDWILLVVLALYLIGGYVRGFFMTLGSVLGFAAGAVAAFYLTPLLVEAASGWWRILVAVLSIVVLIAVGQVLGAMIARPFRRISDRTGLGLIERIAGALLNVLTCALVIIILSFSAGQLGVASITMAINSSQVISTLESWTPARVQQAIAQARAAVLAQSGIPEVADRLFPEQQAPSESVQNDALTAASDSVLRINGTAEACRQNQSGSGFAAADGLVVTNAHVVAGVDEPLVETPGGRAYRGEVVYFDPDTDLAVISAPDLPVAPLETGGYAADGELTTFMGYPLGGPFKSSSATVQGLGYTSTVSREGQASIPREVYQLAADVQQGNSGGPLLDQDGRVIGVIFAKASGGQTGYALSLTELDPVLQQLGSLTVPVNTGACTRG